MAIKAVEPDSGPLPLTGDVRHTHVKLSWSADNPYPALQHFPFTEVSVKLVGDFCVCPGDTLRLVWWKTGIVRISSR